MYLLYLVYIFISFLLATTTLVLGVKNPVHSILFLILTFINGSIILFCLNLEFFAIVFLVVYLGAIVVLFLFIIMMLDLKILNTKQQIMDFFSYQNIYIYLIIIEILVFINKDFILVLDLNEFREFNTDFNKFLINNKFQNFWSSVYYNAPIRSIGKLLYCEYKTTFLLCGVILFISMIGSIVVTVEDFLFLTSKRQDVMKQNLRNSIHSIFNFKIFSRQIN